MQSELGKRGATPKKKEKEKQIISKNIEKNYKGIKKKIKKG